MVLIRMYTLGVQFGPGGPCVNMIPCVTGLLLRNFCNYDNEKTPLFTLDPYYGNLRLCSVTATQLGFGVLILWLTIGTVHGLVSGIQVSGFKAYRVLRCVGLRRTFYLWAFGFNSEGGFMV